MTPLFTFRWPQTLIEIGVTIVIALLIRWAVRKAIRGAISVATKHAGTRKNDEDLSRAEQVLTEHGGIDTTRDSQRAETLGSVLRSVTDVVIVIVVVLMVMTSVGIQVGPLIASLGIGGLALGFGAQTLVKDFISGMFLILEDQYGVGDYVSVNGIEGTVTEVGFRVTTIQDSKGAIWYVRNGEISKLGNQTQGWSTSFIEIPVVLEEDPFQVITVLEQVVEDIEADPTWKSQMLEPPTVLGLSSFTNRTMTFAVLTKCPGNQQWAVEREVRARAVKAFQAAGIEMPSYLAEARALASPTAAQALAHKQVPLAPPAEQVSDPTQKSQPDADQNDASATNR